MTGLETAIILVAFVITAAAFSFVILNMGFLTAGKTQSVIATGMKEASNAILVDSGLIGQFVNHTQNQQELISLTKVTFYLKLSQGAVLTIERQFPAIYSGVVTIEWSSSLPFLIQVMVASP